MDIASEAKQAAKGGVWTDENLEQSLDWQGETGSDAAAVDSTAIHQPKTKTEIGKEILNKAAIDQDVLNAITAKVQTSLLQQSGASEQTITQLVEHKMMEHREIVEKWIETINAKVTKSQNMDESAAVKHFNKLDEQIATLEHKIDTIIGSMTQHGSEETRLIHEAHKIIMDRKAQDEEGESEPSIYNRMDKRVETLTEQLKAIEPYADAGTKRIVSNANKVNNTKKKFGRMM